MQTFSVQETVLSLTFGQLASASPDELHKLVTLALADGTIHFFPVAPSTLAATSLLAHDDAANVAAWEPFAGAEPSSLLLSGSDDGTASLWLVQATLPSVRATKIWAWAAPKPFGGAVEAAAWAREGVGAGRALAFGAGKAVVAAYVTQRGVEASQCQVMVKPLGTFDSTVTGVAFSPPLGALVASMCGQCQIWAVADLIAGRAEPLRKLSFSAPFISLAVSPTLPFVAVGLQQNAVRVFKFKFDPKAPTPPPPPLLARAKVEEIEFGGFLVRVKNLRFASDGAHLLCAGGPTLHFWRLSLRRDPSERVLAPAGDEVKANLHIFSPPSLSRSSTRRWMSAPMATPSRGWMRRGGCACGTSRMRRRLKTELTDGRCFVTTRPASRALLLPTSSRLTQIPSL
jgi:WD40 repeat protein